MNPGGGKQRHVYASRPLLAAASGPSFAAAARPVAVYMSLLATSRVQLKRLANVFDDSATEDAMLANFVQNTSTACQQHIYNTTGNRWLPDRCRALWMSR